MERDQGQATLGENDQVCPVSTWQFLPRWDSEIKVNESKHTFYYPGVFSVEVILEFRQLFVC